jgi:hypothetical protein
MYKEELKKEQRTLSQIRKTLSNIVKDVTPLAGNPNPLSNGTIEEIKYCFAVISGREKELADKLGFDQAKPHYADGAQPSSSALNFVKLSKKKVV